MRDVFTITVKQFAKGAKLPEGYRAYLWTECGDGAMEEAKYVNADWWIKCGHRTFGMSYCVCPDSILYCFHDSDKTEIETKFQAVLKERRESWSKHTGIDCLKFAPAYPTVNPLK